MGYEAEDLIDRGLLNERDLQNFLYPHDKEIAAVGIRGIYLNNYIRWDSKAQHEMMIESYNYESDFQQRTFDTYNDLDCYHYSGLHDKIKYLKWGYSKVSDHATREIRLRRMSRSEGIDLVQKYINIEPKDTELFCNWLGIEKNKLFEEVNKFRSNSIWSKKSNSWVLEDTITNHFDDKRVDSVTLGTTEKCNFNSSSKRTKQKEIGRYTLLGRGWVDS